MGLLDSLAGQVLGSLSSSNGNPPGGLVEALGGLLNSQQVGGISGLITAFEQNGLGPIIASWVGSGQNLPISSEQLQSVLGNEQIQAIAQKMGLSTQEISGHLAELLPQIVDKLTPGGSVPDANASGGLLGMIKGLGF